MSPYGFICPLLHRLTFTDLPTGPQHLEPPVYIQGPTERKEKHCFKHRTGQKTIAHTFFLVWVCIWLYSHLGFLTHLPLFKVPRFQMFQKIRSFKDYITPLYLATLRLSEKHLSELRMKSQGQLWVHSPKLLHSSALEPGNLNWKLSSFFFRSLPLFSSGTHYSLVSVEDLWKQAHCGATMFYLLPLACWLKATGHFEMIVVISVIWVFPASLMARW